MTCHDMFSTVVRELSQVKYDFTFTMPTIRLNAVLVSAIFAPELVN